VDCEEDEINQNKRWVEGIMDAFQDGLAGGMISSLLHILIVTPVIFLWLREREFKNGTLFGTSIRRE